MDWTKIIGEDCGQFCDRLSERAPHAADTLSPAATRLLFTRALEARAEVAVELGTGSHFGIAVLCYALHFASKADFVGEQFEILSYAIGSAANGRNASAVPADLLPSELLGRIHCRRPTTAADIRAEHAPDSLSFVFINGDGRHPWPTLNLLAVLDCLRPGADVLVHDVGPSERDGGPTAKGVMHLLEGLAQEDGEAGTDDPPSVRTVVVPPEKDVLRDRLLVSLYSYPWEVEPSTVEMTRVFA